MGAFRRTFRTHFLRCFQILDAFSRGILGESPKLFQIALCCPMSVCHAIYVMFSLARRVREIEMVVLCHFESFLENGDNKVCVFFFCNAEPCRVALQVGHVDGVQCSQLGAGGPQSSQAVDQDSVSGRDSWSFGVELADGDFKALRFQMWECGHSFLKFSTVMLLCS